MSQPDQPAVPQAPHVPDLPVEVIDGVEYIRLPLSEHVALLREVAELRQENAQLRERLALLEEVNAKLVAQLKAIEEKLGLNSGNSSLPPSSDRPGNKPRRNRGKSGRKKGGQKGRRGMARALLPPEAVTHTVLCALSGCPVCGGVLQPSERGSVHQQKVEVPRITPVVTDYVRPVGFCERCGRHMVAPLPVGVDEGLLGPRALAIGGWLSGGLRLSRRRVKLLFERLLGITVSLGTISKAEGRVSRPLAVPHEQALGYVQHQGVVGADETSVPLPGQRGWLWLATTPAVSVFLVRDNRARRSALELLGQGFKGVLLTDRYSAYACFDGLRQLCLAHLARDFGRIEDRGGEDRRIGHQLRLRLRFVFHWWHRFRHRELDRVALQVKVQPHKEAIEDWLEDGVALGSEKTARTCQNLLDVWPHLWTFLTHDGVEPTNNASEQRLRHFVCWRRSSGGPQSERGQRFIERLLTVVQSCASQGRDVLDYLHQAILAGLQGTEPPSLLPPPAQA